MDANLIGVGTAIAASAGTLVVGSIAGIYFGRRYRPCRTPRCQQRQQCIAEYQANPEGYQDWLESKGDAYKANCADIPPSTNKFG